MNSIREIIAAVSAHYGSDIKAAPHFNVSSVTFGRWRNGKDHPSEEHALRMAELLQLDGAYVLALSRHERAKCDAARATWRRIADQFREAAMLAALAVGAATLGFNNNAFAVQSPSASDLTGIHIARLWSALRRLLLGVTL